MSNLLPVDGIRAQSLSDAEMRLEFVAAGQAIFPFLLNRKWARQLIAALIPWVNSSSPGKSGGFGKAHYA